MNTMITVVISLDTMSPTSLLAVADPMEGIVGDKRASIFKAYVIDKNQWGMVY